MKCGECGEREATHVKVIKRGKVEITLGAVCSTYCSMILMERVQRWPETYINGPLKAKEKNYYAS